jgi:hypothetical protein
MKPEADPTALSRKEPPSRLMVAAEAARLKAKGVTMCLILTRPIPVPADAQ